MRAQTGGRFMISKLGIAFVLEYLISKKNYCKRTAAEVEGRFAEKRKSRGLCVERTGHYQVLRQEPKTVNNGLRYTQNRTSREPGQRGSVTCKSRDTNLVPLSLLGSIDKWLQTNGIK